MQIKERLLPTIAVTFIFLYYISNLLANGLEYLQQDLIYGITSGLCIFLLPALISKVILKKKYFGVGYILSTLIYPLTYLSILLLHHYLNIPALLSYRIFALLILFAVPILTLVVTFTEKRTHVKKISRTILGILIVIGLLLGTRHLLNLGKDSLLSLDFLQHNAVSMQMSEGELCLTPNDCSSLFKKLGYTTYYHTIQTTLTVGYGLETGIAEVSLMTAFIVTSALTLFTFFQKHIKDDELAFLGALISIFFFELGAYSFNFIIPQTFVLLLFINLLTEKNLTWIKLFICSPILFAIHFALGPFFVGILFIYKVFFNSKSKISKTITILSFLTVIITFVANLRGFSIEKLIQQADITQLGFYTNYYFPHNLEFLAQQYGLILIPLLLAIVYFLFKKDTSNNVLFSITYLSICLSCYFLGPTYANKFLIGSSVFIVFLIINLIIDLKFKRFLKLLLLFSLFISTIPFYLINYSKYTNFYLQSNGTISALNRNDSHLIQYLKTTDIDCQILSDPYTQIVVTGQTPYDTSGGQYQELFTRKALIEFIRNPSDTTYEELLSSNDIDTPLCFLLSTRLYSSEKYVNKSNISWLNSMYEYEINTNYNIGDFTGLIDFLKTKGYEISYSDEHFQLFTPTIE
ncbi:hypothetical protein K8R20_01305 [bacterium]|nr:hypothetical protein [bacterium]